MLPCCTGFELTGPELADWMLKLQDEGRCHNINFVTPEHCAPQVRMTVEPPTAAGATSPLRLACQQLLASTLHPVCHAQQSFQQGPGLLVLDRNNVLLQQQALANAQSHSRRVLVCSLHSSCRCDVQLCVYIPARRLRRPLHQQLRAAC